MVQTHVFLISTIKINQTQATLNCKAGPLCNVKVISTKKYAFTHYYYEKVFFLATIFKP